MFDRLTEFLQGFGAPERDNGHDSENETEIAIAALLFHVMDADGVREDAERQKLRDLLRSRYDLSGERLDAIIARGAEEERESVDLYAFTSVLKRELDEDGKRDLVEILWEMVYSDGKWHELEENLVWRVSELLGVANRDRVLLRRRVADRLNVPLLADDKDDDDDETADGGGATGASAGGSDD